MRKSLKQRQPWDRVRGGAGREGTAERGSEREERERTWQISVLMFEKTKHA